MEEILQDVLTELDCSTSLEHNLLKIEAVENFSLDTSWDQTIREYFISSNIVNFLHTYFSDAVFSDKEDLTFTAEDKDNSDFNLIFNYVFKIVYYVIVSYFLFFSLPVSGLKMPEKFYAHKELSSSLFSFNQSYVYFKVYMPLEDCKINFMYKKLSDNEANFKKGSVYVVPYTLCNNISSIKGRHLIFDFSV